MTDFVTAFNRLATLSNEAVEELQKYLQTKSFDKGELLLKSGEICRKLFFIDEGLTKTFFCDDDKEFIMRFFPEHTFTTVLDSFTTQTPSSYDIMALEKTTVTYILQTGLEILCKNHHCIETAFRKLLS